MLWGVVAESFQEDGLEDDHDRCQAGERSGFYRIGVYEREAVAWSLETQQICSVTCDVVLRACIMLLRWYQLTGNSSGAAVLGWREGLVMEFHEGCKVPKRYIPGTFFFFVGTRAAAGQCVAANPAQTRLPCAEAASLWSRKRG